MARVAVWLAGIVALVCALAAGVAVILPGRAVLPPDSLRALGFDACPPPCWAGIQVGETALDAVAVAFETHIQAPRKGFDAAANGAVYWGVIAPGANTSRSTSFSGNLMARSETHAVSYLHVNLDLPLWYLLLTLGDPETVELQEPFPDVRRLEMVLNWSLGPVRAVATVPIESVTDWTLEARANSLSVAEDGAPAAFGRSLRAWRLLGATPWRGFAPLARYLREAGEASGRSPAA